MTKTPGDGFRPMRLLRAFRTVVRSLVWRKPEGDPGETRVAAEPQRVRPRAVTRLEELTGTGSGANEYDQDLVESIMTDDGGGQPERRSKL